MSPSPGDAGSTVKSATRGVGATVTDFTIVVDAPPESRTVRVTSKVPADPYTCATASPDADDSSPKSQERVYGDTPPATLGVNGTGSPATGASGRTGRA